MAGYLGWNIRGNFEFAMQLRGATAGAMLVAAFAQAVATVIFHTVTANRILSPSVMGFDSLFVLMQTVLVALFGGQVLADTQGTPRLVVQTLVMVGFATLLYRWLFVRLAGGLYVTLLVGVVLGMAFNTVSTFLERLLHPTDYDLLSLALFGRLTSVDAAQLPLAFAVCAAVGVVVWRRRHVLDGLLLGRELATSIGIDHRRELTIMLALVALLVSFSTALVGPMTFFGFALTGVPLGVARRAVDGLRELAMSKSTPGGGKLGDVGFSQYAVAKAEALIDAARCNVRYSFQELWDCALADRAPSMVARARLGWSSCTKCGLLKWQLV